MQKQKIKYKNISFNERNNDQYAHRLSTILNSEKIYVIDKGKVVDHGKHEELLNSSKTYKNFYEKQIKRS